MAEKALDFDFGEFQLPAGFPLLVEQSESGYDGRSLLAGNGTTCPQAFAFGLCAWHRESNR